MRLFFSTLPRNLLGCFKGRVIVWHLLAIGLTFILVTSGFDWHYFLWTRSPELRSWMFPAVHLGAMLPVLVPVSLLVLGSVEKTGNVSLAGWAMAQAELIGAAVAAGYKALTGRAHPTHAVGADLTHVFRFGLLRGGVFWGWPSSHTTIAFSMAVSVFCPLSKAEMVGLYGRGVRALYWHRRLDDHPLVLRFRGRGDFRDAGWCCGGQGVRFECVRRVSLHNLHLARMVATRR